MLDDRQRVEFEYRRKFSPEEQASFGGDSDKLEGMKFAVITPYRSGEVGVEGFLNKMRGPKGSEWVVVHLSGEQVSVGIFY